MSDGASDEASATPSSPASPASPQMHTDADAVSAAMHVHPAPHGSPLHIPPSLAWLASAAGPLVASRTGTQHISAPWAQLWDPSWYVPEGQLEPATQVPPAVKTQLAPPSSRDSSTPQPCCAGGLPGSGDGDAQVQP
jgi:hypothetical protein